MSCILKFYEFLLSLSELVAPGHVRKKIQGRASGPICLPGEHHFGRLPGISTQREHVWLAGWIWLDKDSMGFPLDFHGISWDSPAVQFSMTSSTMSIHIVLLERVLMGYAARVGISVSFLDCLDEFSKLFVIRCDKM